MILSSEGLHRYAIFAAMLGMAGLPLYIFAPKFYVDSYGVSLTAIAGILFFLRLLDFVQDPILGWVADYFKNSKRLLASLGCCVLALSVFGLFVISSPISPLIWFSLCMVFLFTSFSLLSILFYANGVAAAKRLPGAAHIRLAGWREAGSLTGICIACVLPFIVSLVWPDIANPFTIFAICFALLALGAVVSMSSEWTQTNIKEEVQSGLFRDQVIRRLLVIAFLNAAPVAVTSTLFLFFVEYRLGQAELAGPFLLLFFIMAAISVPLWSRLSDIHSPKTVLQFAMVLSIIAFAGAYFLETGNFFLFGLICLFSGMALGADMTLLPALFARRIAAKDLAQGQAFGLWNFSAKASLAVAAIATLPALENAGFQTGVDNSPTALARLSLLYALVPCALKLLALFVLSTTNLKEQ